MAERLRAEAAASPQRPEQGVLFPRGGEGRRGTMPANRAVFADAARAVDVSLARRIDAAEDWRSAYAPFVRELTALGGRSTDAATSIARAGLTSMRSRLVFRREGEERPLEGALEVDLKPSLSTATIEGQSEPLRELVVPYAGELLRGDGLRRRLGSWVDAAIIEPSAAEAVGAVIEHPEWLQMDGTRAAVLGAGAETSPLGALSSWGAEVIALDLPRPAVWERLLETARHGAGRVHLPVRDGAAGGDLAQRAGADLIADLPEIAAWLRTLAADGPLVLGVYAYADGALHVQATAAADVLASDLSSGGHDVAVAYTGTPTDCYLVPGEVVEGSIARRTGRGLRRAFEDRLRVASRGRLFAPAYPELVHGEDGREWGVADGLVGKQGPNYALAKRLQRWRSTVARSEGRPASFNVAPSTWTQSVTKNKLLAAGYHGARHVGMEVFAPETMRTVMTALMVHDLHRPWRTPLPSDSTHPDELFVAGAVHGGYWRTPYNLHSTLVWSSLLGLPQAYGPSLRR